ncbi:MAG TPA: PBP1A family penicillin-binding protein [Candidatus Hydrogenedentes bacterium]|nr:PBP1A family penicillin-binding protein [Candidatus Hydrogenedentota bacterium]
MTDSTGRVPLYKRSPRSCGGIFFVFALVVSSVWGGCLGFFVGELEKAKTRIAALEDFRPKVGSKFYADPTAGGELLGEYSYTTNYRQLVSLNQVPLHVQKAFLATEDHVFYEHHGVRPDAIIKAALRMLRTGRVQSGSTITQQIVRNLEPTQVGRERTIARKLEEILIALQLEREYTKDEILELYLNQIHLGGSAWGIEAAARQYFGKHCDELTLGEGAVLAGLTRAPNANRPDRYPQNARARRDVVLRQMLENGFITQEQYEAAVAEPLEEQVISPEERLEMMARGKAFLGPNQFLAPYFVEEVRRQIMSPSFPGKVSKQELLEGGLEVYTTLDLSIQRAAEEALLKGLDEFDAARLESLRKQGKENEFVPVSGALVCLDNRPGCEGYVRALVGGRDYAKNQFNTATQARRQPGSSVKPFVWAAAIDNGYTAAHVERDEPFVRISPSGKVWAPKNFDGEFMGPITLRRAIELSRNVVSVRLVERLGVPLVRSYLQRAGIRQSEIPDVVGLTIALGTPEITVLEQCTAYATLAKNGTYCEPTFVKEIRNSDGSLRYKSEIQLSPGAIPENVAYVVTYMLQGAAEWGTGARSAKLGRPRAGKTGTTNESRDAWFCGYTPDFTAVVWIGYRDNRPLGRGINYTGGRLACPIWTDFMIKAEENLPVRDFTVPKGVVFYNIDKETGLAGGSFREAFIEGTAPPTSRPIFPETEEAEQILEENLLGGLATDTGSSTAETESPTKPSGSLEPFDPLAGF